MQDKDLDSKIDIEIKIDKSIGLTITQCEEISNQVVGYFRFLVKQEINKAKPTETPSGLIMPTDPFEKEPE